MQHRDIVRAEPPAFAQRLAAPGRVEQACIDTPSEQFQALETASLKLQALADTGHQGDCRASMEPAQVVGEQACQQTQAVLAGVLREVGVEAADDCDSQAPGRAQCAEPQRPLGGDVQHIRALPPPAAQQLVHRHLTPLQTGVTRQRPATAEHQVRVVVHGGFAGLARAHHLHLMAALTQPFAKAAKGVGHAVDFGWEGFADQGNA